MSKLIPASEAGKLVKDGATLYCSGVGLAVIDGETAAERKQAGQGGGENEVLFTLAHAISSRVSNMGMAVAGVGLLNRGQTAAQEMGNFIEGRTVAG